MVSCSSLLLFLLLAHYSQEASAAELVLTEPFRVVEASRDSDRYTGDDGQLIHGGDHWHDPCHHAIGLKFTTTRGDKPNGFLVVNDCQITLCRKWTTPSGSSGGETVVFDIVDSTTDSDGMTFSSKRWRILEESSCSCDGEGEDSCYVGKLLHVDNYDDYQENKYCESIPGSIPCEEETGDVEFAPTFTISEPTILDPTIPEQLTEILSNPPVLSPGAIAGIVAAAFFALILCCCCCRRCCRRPKKLTNEEEPLGKEVKKEQTGWLWRRNTSPTYGNVNGTDDDSRGSGSGNQQTSSWLGKKTTSSKAVVVAEQASKVSKAKSTERMTSIENTTTRNDVEAATRTKQEVTKKGNEEMNTEIVDCTTCCGF